MKNSIHHLVRLSCVTALAACTADTLPAGFDGGGQTSRDAGGGSSAPIIQAFSADQTSVTSGTQVTLTWRVTDARSLTITAGAETLLETTDMFEGTLMSRPVTATTEFVLTAIGPGGSADRTVTVTVTTPTGPEILRFTADPNPGAPGGTTTLSWVTTGAERIKISTDTKELLDTTEMLDSGTLSVELEAASTTFTLEATGVGMSATETLVVTTESPPTIDNFAVTPATFSGASAMVSITWTTANAQMLTLQAEGTDVPEFTGAATGTIAVSVTQTTRFVLTAQNGGTTVSDTKTVTKTSGEVEPNDDASTARPITGGASAMIGTPGDVDFYSFTVVAGGNVFAETSDGAGGCNFDTVIALIGPDGTTVVGSDDDGGTTPCSRIDPSRDPFAADLPAGTYYIQVSAFDSSATGSYTLSVVAGPPACGNRIIEVSQMEQCDDGNTTAGDGCDASCQIEAAGMLSGIGTEMTFMESVSAGQVDVYFVTLPSDGYIYAETFIPTAPDCMTGDTVIALFDNAGTELGGDDDDGERLCSRIDPAADVWARVPAGTYQVRVSALSGSIPAYSVLIRTSGPGCGNRIIEGMEGCDDGNMVAGDGCSPTCRFEGGMEIEPNDTSTQATSIGTKTKMTGEITPAMDIDLFAVDVPAGHHIEAFVSVGSFERCPGPEIVQLRLLDTDGTTALVTNSFAGPDGRCGRIEPRGQAINLAGGRYYLEVSELTGAPVGRYFLHINVIAPACGNNILETNETCDDGNTADGDGCSSSCNFEIAHVIRGTGGSATVQLPTPTSFQVIQVDVTTPGASITATTSDPMGMPGMCMVRGALELRSGSTLLGSDRFAFSGCPAINFPTDQWAVDLEVKSYFLVVLNEGTTTGALDVNVGIVAPACGNGVLEGRAGEACDDGNRAAGDGCFMCQFEAGIVQEMEANGDRMSATQLTVTPGQSTLVVGAITPMNDVDYYAFTLNAPGVLTARTYGSLGNQNTCNGDTVMSLEDSGGMQLANNDDGGFGLCSLINPTTAMSAATLQAGTHYLKVESFMNSSTVRSYVLDVSVQ